MTIDYTSTKKRYIKEIYEYVIVTISISFGHLDKITFPCQQQILYLYKIRNKGCQPNTVYSN